MLTSRCKQVPLRRPPASKMCAGTREANYAMTPIAFLCVLEMLWVQVCSLYEQKERREISRNAKYDRAEFVGFLQRSSIVPLCVQRSYHIAEDGTADTVLPWSCVDSSGLL